MKQFRTCPMNQWTDVNANLAITDPPFGIGFGDAKSNYVRDEGHVVDGYVEWDVEEYDEKVRQLVDVCAKNTVEDGQCLIFSGWNNSPSIHGALECHDEWVLEGKLYWEYNFAPYCKHRPAHNAYEIYWARKSDDWYYTNECSYDHCQDGEANLSVISVKREYTLEREKYPTRLPPKIVEILLEHFSQPGDLLFDPCAGSGTVGLVAEKHDRKYAIGDSNSNASRIFRKARNDLDVTS